MSNRKNTRAGQGWFMSAAQHLQLTLEIYSGKSVRFESIQVEVLRVAENKGVEFRLLSITAKFIWWDGTKFVREQAQQPWCKLENHGERWEQKGAGLDLIYLGPNKLVHGSRDPAMISLDADYLYDEDHLTPFVEVMSERDNTWRTGHDLSDRVVEKAGYRRRAPFRHER